MDSQPGEVQSAVNIDVSALQQVVGRVPDAAHLGVREGHQHARSVWKTATGDCADSGATPTPSNLKDIIRGAAEDSARVRAGAQHSRAGFISDRLSGKRPVQMFVFGGVAFLFRWGASDRFIDLTKRIFLSNNIIS